MMSYGIVNCSIGWVPRGGYRLLEDHILELVVGILPSGIVEIQSLLRQAAMAK